MILHGYFIDLYVVKAPMASHCESWSHHVPPRLLGVPNLRTNRQRGHPRCQRRHGHRWRLRDHPRWIEAAFGWHWANVTRYNSKILQGSRVLDSKTVKNIDKQISCHGSGLYIYSNQRTHLLIWSRILAYLFWTFSLAEARNHPYCASCSILVKDCKNCKNTQKNMININSKLINLWFTVCWLEGNHLYLEGHITIWGTSHLNKLVVYYSGVNIGPKEQMVCQICAQRSNETNDHSFVWMDASTGGCHSNQRSQNSVRSVLFVALWPKNTSRFG